MCCIGMASLSCASSGDLLASMTAEMLYCRRDTRVALHFCVCLDDQSSEILVKTFSSRFGTCSFCFRHGFGNVYNMKIISVQQQPL